MNQISARIPIPAALIVSLVFAMACTPADDNVDSDVVKTAVDRYERQALTQQKTAVRNLARGLVVKVFPAAVNKNPKKEALESLAYQLGHFIPLSGGGVRAIVVEVKHNARKNPSGKFKPMVAAWWNKKKNGRAWGIREKAVVAADQKKIHPKLTFPTTFSNGARTDIRMHLYYDEGQVKRKLKRIRENLRLK